MTEQEQLGQFITAIRSKADTEAEMILSETEAYCKEQMEEMRRSLSSERAKALRVTLEESQKQAGKTISDAVRESAKVLSEKQQEIREDVFARVCKRLRTFVGSNEYVPFLKKSAVAIRSVFKDAPCTVYYSVSDEAHLPLLRELFPEGTVFSADPKICFGGLKACSFDGAISVDDTLDASIAEQKRVFAETSGLDVS